MLQVHGTYIQRNRDFKVSLKGYNVDSGSMEGFSINTMSRDGNCQILNGYSASILKWIRPTSNTDENETSRM